MRNDKPIVGVLLAVHLQQQRAFIDDDLHQVDPDRVEAITAGRQSGIVGDVGPYQLGPHAAGKKITVLWYGVPLVRRNCREKP